MILLQVQQVARYFGADTLFENVSLDVSDNSRIALVGRNGVGKSTLLKMIIGNESPDAGQITKKKGLTIGWKIVYNKKYHAKWKQKLQIQVQIIHLPHILSF